MKQRLLRRWRGLMMRVRRGTGLGPRGERLARRTLRRAGYRIISVNTRIGRDEADVIALDPDGRTRVIVEVKTRRADDIAPELAVSAEKRRCLQRFAHRWREQDPRHAAGPMRFDVIAIVWRTERAPEVRHYRGAFDADS